MASSSTFQTNLWEIALSRLPAEKQSALKSGLGSPGSFNVQTLTTVVAQAQQRVLSRRWKIKTHHGEVAIRDVFDKMVSWVNKFIAIGDSAVQYDPAHAALPWAAFRLVLQVFVNDNSRATEFAKGLERVALYIYDCALREILYSNRSHGVSKQLESNIVRLYTTILDFMHGARKYFEAKTISESSPDPSSQASGSDLISVDRILASVVKSGDQVIALLQPAAQQASDVVITSGLIDSQIQSESHTIIKNIRDNSGVSLKSHTWIRQQLKENERIVGVLLENHKETNLRFDSIDERAKQQNRLKLLQWLSSVPYREHHQKELNEVLENTGSWFLESHKYRSWKDSSETAVMWLHGAPGTGKSKLMSLALQATLDECGDELPALYFYCSRTAAEPERARADDILRCFVKEISTGNIGHETDQVPEYVAQKYEAAEKIDFAAGRLTVAACRTIIGRFASDHPKLYIFVDALDEVEEHVRHDLVESLRTIMTSAPTSHVKLLVSSRDDIDVASLFSQHKTYRLGINSGENQDDIDSYVKSQLGHSIEQGRIHVRGTPPSQKIQQDIITSLCAKSQGMFRWVSLQLYYISTLHTEADITSRLGRLPRKLSDSYEELWAMKTHSYEPEDMSRLDLALSLLLTDRTPTPAVFARFVFGDGDGHNNNREDDVETGGTISKTLARIALNRPEDCIAHQNDPLLGMITGLCFGLVILDTTTQSFRFAHVSVQEYIVSCRDEYKLVSQSHQRIAKRCLSILVEPESVVDSVQPFTNRPLWPNEERDKRSSAIFPHGYYVNVLTSDNTIDWISMSWAYYVARSNEFRPTPPLKDLETRLQDSIDVISRDSINPSVFLSACHYGNLQLVRKWLNHHPRLARLTLCLANERSSTAFHFAVESDDPEIVACLMNAGAEIGACELQPKNNLGVALPWALGTPLHLAVAQGSLQVVFTLLQNRSQVHAKDCLEPCLDIEEDLAIALRVAVLKKYEQIVQALLDHRASPNARIAGELSVFLQLLQVDHGASPIDRMAKDFSLLHMAIQCSIPRIVRLLLDHGANIHQKSEPLLERAVMCDKMGDGQCMRLLLDAGADPRAMSPESMTPLGKAAELNRKALVQMLIDFGVGVNEPVNTHGLTSLMAAAFGGNDKIIEVLLAAGADPNTASVFGYNALIFAAERGNLEAVKALLPLTTNLDSQAVNSNTALSHAARNGHQAIVEALLQAGAEVDPQEPGPHCSFLDPIKRRSGYGLNALAEALFSKNEAIFRLILRFLAQRESQGGYAKALHSLDLVGWASFSIKGHLEDLSTHVEDSRAKGEVEGSEVPSALDSMLTHSKNPFERFAWNLVLNELLRQIQSKNFVEKNKHRAEAIIEERKEQHAKE